MLKISLSLETRVMREGGGRREEEERLTERGLGVTGEEAVIVSI